MEIIAITSGLIGGLLIPYLAAMKKHGNNFAWPTYYHENKWRVLAGLVASLAAIGATYSLTPDLVKQGAGPTFNTLLAIAAAAPVPVLQRILSPNK